MLRHFFIFASSEHGEKEVDEPFGFDSVGFTIQQKESGKGRDIFYSGNGEASYTMGDKVDRFGHYLDLWLLNYQLFRHQAVIFYRLELGDGTSITLKADMSSQGFKTNMVNQASIKFIQVNSLYKERYDTPVNIYADKTLKGNDIAPLVPDRMLLKAKPVFQQSQWNLPTDTVSVFNDSGPVYANYYNVIKNTVKYDIKTSQGLWLEDASTGAPDDDAGKNFIYITAASNLSKVIIDFKLNIKYRYRPTYNNGLSGHKAQMKIQIKYGANYDDATLLTVFETPMFTGNTDIDFDIPPLLTLNIPFVNATDKIWIYFTSIQFNGAVTFTDFGESSIDISATSVALNTVIPVFRLIDVMRYAAKSAGEFDFYAPQFDMGGEYYDLYITNAQQMRGLVTQPFNISNKTIIEDCIDGLFNGDYQLEDNTVVVNAYWRDYYRDYFIAEFDEQQLEGFSLSSSERSEINQIKIGNKNYATQKESESGNTLDTVHGDATWLVPNESVNNTLEYNCGFVIDPFLIEDIRRKAYDLSDTTATQDDGKIVMLDCVALPAGTNFTETQLLQHRKIDGSPLDLLYINNDGSFSWVLLGIAQGSTFTILSGVNTGAYTVLNVTDTQLKLIPNTVFNVQEIVGENTTFKYYIDSDVVLTNRTNEGFTVIENFIDQSNFSNLRFTDGRRLRKYHSEQLATAMLARPNQAITNTSYLYNKDATTQYLNEGVIVEGGDFIPTGAILDINNYEANIIMSLAQFWDIANKTITQRGYIKIIAPTGLPVKAYIKQGTFKPTSKGDYELDERKGVFECVLEERFEQFLLNIYADNIMFKINDSIQPSAMQFSSDDNGLISIFDETGLRLYPPVHYTRVQINDSGVFSNITELHQVLMQYATMI